MPEDNRTNIKVDSDVHERHNEKREELGLSWTEYMRRLEWDGDRDANEIAEELKNELSMANDPTVEVDVERILGRIEDLEAQLPRKVADELEGRR